MLVAVFNGQVLPFNNSLYSLFKLVEFKKFTDSESFFHILIGIYGSNSAPC